MNNIDPKVTEYMREMGKKRWLKSTPEERKRQGQILAEGRRKKREKLSTGGDNT